MVIAVQGGHRAITTAVDVARQIGFWEQNRSGNLVGGQNLWWNPVSFFASLLVYWGHRTKKVDDHRSRAPEITTN